MRVFSRQAEASEGESGSVGLQISSVFLAHGLQGAHVGANREQLALTALLRFHHSGLEDLLQSGLLCHISPESFTQYPDPRTGEPEFLKNNAGLQQLKATLQTK
ncbi:hypothetical protein MHYP_G00148990 [Metynnis hypsauchen]